MNERIDEKKKANDSDKSDFLKIGTQILTTGQSVEKE